jgi:hypothetical protein
MHADVHLVRTRPPILDVPPLVWIDPPGAPKVCTPTSAPLWEWAAPPPRRTCRRWRVAVPPQIALAIVGAVSLFAITFAVVVASSPSPSLSPQLRALPVPDEPIWCACVWWPSGLARSLTG